MSADKITDLVHRLNKELFFDCLDIEYFVDDNEPSWLIQIKGQEHIYRCFWLNTKRHFEIRHGGGCDFIWWIDLRIQDEIAKVFDGRLEDDGGSGYDEKIYSWNTPNTFEDYLRDRIQPKHMQYTPGQWVYRAKLWLSLERIPAYWKPYKAYKREQKRLKKK